MGSDWRLTKKKTYLTRVDLEMVEVEVEIYRGRTLRDGADFETAAATRRTQTLAAVDRSIVEQVELTRFE